MSTLFVPQNEMELQRSFAHKVYEMNVGRGLTACVRTYGCQMNEHDSEKIKGMLTEMGYNVVSEYSTQNPENVPDLVIFNTCCVRENAEDRVFGHLGALKAAKRLKPSMITCVCGCMTEQKHICDEIKQKFNNVDLVFGTRTLHMLPEYLYGCLTKKGRMFKVSGMADTVAEGVPVKRDSTFQAWVTVMYGCNNFCSYCIVPYVRGRERSRKASDIVDEVRNLCQQGYTEITLLGQNVNSYGKDLESNGDCRDFADLLRKICAETSIERVRFMTSHPKDLSDRLIDVISENNAVCPQLHLPVQSGSSRILKNMNRHYTREYYIDLVNKVRSKIPGITLTTDIIVGFPGETEEDFSETLSLMEQIRFDSAFTFIYSPRVGTPAAKSPDQIPEDVVKNRFDRLISLQNAISKEINDGLVGTVQDVLCEGTSKNNASRYTGRTGGNKVVNFDCPCEFCNIVGKIVKVRIDSVQTWSLEGTVI